MVRRFSGVVIPATNEAEKAGEEDDAAFTKNGEMGNFSVPGFVQVCSTRKER